MKRLLDLDIAWWSDLPAGAFDDFDDHIDLEPLDDDTKLLTTQKRMWHIYTDTFNVAAKVHFLN